jgi:glycosidase
MLFPTLRSLATETEWVRSRLATYANDLLSLGIDGLRLDAAKHIASSDIANILSRLSSKPYITQVRLYCNAIEQSA